MKRGLKEEEETSEAEETFTELDEKRIERINWTAGIYGGAVNSMKRGLKAGNWLRNRDERFVRSMKRGLKDKIVSSVLRFPFLYARWKEDWKQ